MSKLRLMTFLICMLFCATEVMANFWVDFEKDGKDQVGTIILVASPVGAHGLKERKLWAVCGPTDQSVFFMLPVTFDDSIENPPAGAKIKIRGDVIRDGALRRLIVKEIIDYVNPFKK